MIEMLNICIIGHVASFFKVEGGGAKPKQKPPNRRGRGVPLTFSNMPIGKLSVTPPLLPIQSHTLACQIHKFEQTLFRS